MPEEAFRTQFIGGNIAPVAPGFAQFTDDLLVWLRPDLAPRDRSLATVATQAIWNYKSVKRLRAAMRGK